MDQVTLDGKTYIGSKKAAQECSYTQDYVGQLARKGLIDAQRVSGQWYIFLASLQAYKANAETFKPEPPKYQPDPNVDAGLEVEGKEYVSAARAAKLTEYNQDYVGQLARAGKIPSRQIGTRWYVEKDALFAHKKEKDAMLRAVQAESVGLKRPVAIPTSLLPNTFAHKKPDSPLLVYSKDEKALFPEIAEAVALKAIPSEIEGEIPDMPDVENKIPIRIFKMTPAAESQTLSTSAPVPINDLWRSEIKIQKEGYRRENAVSGNTIFSKLFLPTAFAAVLLVVVGIGAYKRDLIYGYVSGNTTQSASVASGTAGIGDFLEIILTRELVYLRK